MKNNRYLSEFGFVKSAKVAFKVLNLDGNILFTGVNGVGKTTSLRAVLFFYSADSRNLGINGNKKGFIDYYLPQENSYLFYTINININRKILLISYRKNYSIKFKMFLFNTDKINYQNIFLNKNNSVLSQNELWDRLGNYFSTPTLGKEDYLDILYGKNKKYNGFALFNDNKKSYQGYIQILTSLFLNKKVDSKTIQEVLINSIFTSQEKENSKIRLRDLNYSLNTFKNLYEANKIYGNSKDAIENVINFYNKIKSSEFELVKNIVNTEKYLILQDNKISKKIEEKSIIEIQKNDIEKKIDFINEEYQKNLQQITEKLTKLKISLEEIEKKQSYYKKENIEQKIEEFNKLEEYKINLTNLENKYRLFMEDYKNIEENQDIKIQQISLQYDELISKNKTQYNDKIENIEKNIFALKEKQQLSIQEQNNKFNEEIEKLNKMLNNSIIKLNNLQNEEKNIKNSKFEFDLENDLNKELKNKDKLQIQISLIEKDINLKNRELENLKDNYQKKSLQLQKEYNDKISIPKQKKQQLENILKGDNQNSLISQMYANNLELSKYFYFIKDELLLKTFENIKFDNHSTNTIFEVEFQNLEDIVPNQKIETLIKEIDKELKKLDSFYKEAFNKLEMTYQNDKKQIIQIITDYENELEKLKTNQTQTMLKIKNLNEEKYNLEQKFNNEKISKLQQITLNINELKDENKDYKNSLIELKTTKETTIKQVKEEFDYKIEQLNKEKSELNQKILNSQNELKIQKDRKISELKKELENILKNKGVDTFKLKTLENKIEIQKQLISQVEKYQKIIYQYEDDKEFLAQENEFKSKLNQLKIEEINIKDSYKNKNQDLSQKKDSIIIELEKIKNEISKLEKEKQTFYKYFTKNQEINKIKNLLNEMIDGYKTNNEQNINENLTLFQVQEILKEGINNYEKLQLKLNELLNSKKIVNLLNVKIFGFNQELDNIEIAYNIKQFEIENQIEPHSKNLQDSFKTNFLTIVESLNNLETKLNDIRNFVNQISKSFKIALNNFEVLNILDIKFDENNSNVVIGQIRKIVDFANKNDTNQTLFLLSNDSSDSLFEFINKNNIDNNEKTKLINKMVDYIYKLVEEIENSDDEAIELIDAFSLKFRIVENNNDTGWKSSLDKIGSEGTDVLIKALIYSAMLAIYKRKLESKNRENDIYIHIMLDEIGKLSDTYFSNLLSFITKYKMFFINATPESKTPQKYKRHYQVSQFNNKTTIQEIIYEE